MRTWQVGNEPVSQALEFAETGKGDTSVRQENNHTKCEDISDKASTLNDA